MAIYANNIIDKKELVTENFEKISEYYKRIDAVVESVGALAVLEENNPILEFDLSNIKSKIKEKWEAFKKWFLGLMEKIGNFIKNIVNKIKDKFSKKAEVEKLAKEVDAQKDLDESASPLLYLEESDSLEEYKEIKLATFTYNSVNYDHLYKNNKFAQDYENTVEDILKTFSDLKKDDVVPETYFKSLGISKKGGIEFEKLELNKETTINIVPGASYAVYYDKLWAEMIEVRKDLDYFESLRNKSINLIKKLDKVIRSNDLFETSHRIAYVVMDYIAKVSKNSEAMILQIITNNMNPLIETIQKLETEIRRKAGLKRA